ncbi:MAG: hypothetical protein NZO58_11425 [Gemmataceae bacterium]|nr:hypothetical protein [Gemmataceae bacterium]
MAQKQSGPQAGQVDNNKPLTSVSPAPLQPKPDWAPPAQPDAKEVRHLSDVGFPLIFPYFNSLWSPDSKKLLLPLSKVVYVYNTETKVMQHLISVPDHGSVLLAPDGEYLYLGTTEQNIQRTGLLKRETTTTLRVGRYHLGNRTWSDTIPAKQIGYRSEYWPLARMNFSFGSFGLLWFRNPERIVYNNRWAFDLTKKQWSNVYFPKPCLFGVQLAPPDGKGYVGLEIPDSSDPGSLVQYSKIMFVDWDGTSKTIADVADLIPEHLPRETRILRWAMLMPQQHSSMWHGEIATVQWNIGLKGQRLRIDPSQQVAGFEEFVPATTEKGEIIQHEFAFARGGGRIQLVEESPRNYIALRDELSGPLKTLTSEEAEKVLGKYRVDFVGREGKRTVAHPSAGFMVYFDPSPDGTKVLLFSGLAVGQVHCRVVDAEGHMVDVLNLVEKK